MRISRAMGPALSVLLVLGLAGLPALGQNKPVAIVNGEPITRQEFDAAWNRVALPDEASEAQRKALQKELLDLMVSELLFQQFLKKNVPAPDPALVQGRLAELEASLKRQGRTLQDHYRDTGQTEERLRADITARIQWNAYVKRHVTDEEAQRYYERHRELFAGALVRVSHIALRVPADGKTKDHEAVKRKLQRIRQEILAGLDFAEAARKYSEDSSAASGGDLGYFPPCATDPDPFIRTASALQVGQVSEVVPSEYGYHLLQVTDRKVGKPTTFEEVKEEARFLCAEELRLKLIEEQRKTAKIEIHGP